MERRYASALLVLLTLGLAPQAAPAQCTPEWSNPFPSPGADGIIHALVVFDDDATGPHLPALYAGGAFASIGGVNAGRIAKWNGTSWSVVGAAMGSTVFALAVFDDDDTGPHLPALYAAGNFESVGIFQVSRIAKWNGSAWSALGTGLNGVAYALAVYDDDGAGPHLPALYVGGLFTVAGTAAASNIAKWDGTTWSALGAGTDSYVSALAVYDDDGAGAHLPALVAGGGFQHAGSATANHIAKWNGTAWSVLQYGTSNGVNDIVNAMVVFDDDGAGPNLPALYVSGFFTSASGVPASRIAKWTGSTWSALGTGLNSTVFALAAFDPDGTGASPAALYAGGSFTTAGGNAANETAKWSGGAWTPLGSGVNNTVFALTGFDNDPQSSNAPALYVAGDFTLAGGSDVGRIARWACPPPGAAPTIDQQPQSQSVCPGESVTFNVKASGPPTLSYRWRKGGQDIPNADQSSYTIDPVTAGDAGTYDVVVSNNGGSVTSDPATLTVLSCGACCYADFTCAITTQAACTATWLGADTACAQCPQPQGACCYTDGTCSITTQAGCTANWLGADTTCDLCPPLPTGACCVAATCTITTAADCSGTWHGAGTTCTPNPCVLHGDMNCDGTVNGQDIDGFVLVLLGLPPYTEYYTWTGGGCDYLNADMNGDGVVNGQDIDPFVDCLLNGNC